MHLAQLNIGRLLKPIDHPQIAEFVNNLDQINALAESSPGFVYRMQDDSGNATHIKVFDDPLVIANMSVWESVEALKDFTYRSGHVEFMKKRAAWFEKPTSNYLVLWWIRVGHRPTLTEAKERLAHLDRHGATSHAFNFRNVFNYRASDRD